METAQAVPTEWELAELEMRFGQRANKTILDPDEERRLRQLCQDRDQRIQKRAFSLVMCLPESLRNPVIRG